MTPIINSKPKMYFDFVSDIKIYHLVCSHSILSFTLLVGCGLNGVWAAEFL